MRVRAKVSGYRVALITAYVVKFARWRLSTRYVAFTGNFIQVQRDFIHDWSLTVRSGVIHAVQLATYLCSCLGTIARPLISNEPWILIDHGASNRRRTFVKLLRCKEDFTKAVAPARELGCDFFLSRVIAMDKVKGTTAFCFKDVLRLFKDLQARGIFSRLYLSGAASPLSRRAKVNDNNISGV